LLIGMGKLQEADAAIESATRCRNENNQQLKSALLATQGLVCLHRGLIGQANSYFRQIDCKDSSFGMGVMANLALSFEYMGLFRPAEVWLKCVLKAAEKSGYAFLQIMSLNNLGSVLRKQGRFDEALHHCSKANHLLDYFKARDKNFPVGALSIVKSDTG